MFKVIDRLLTFSRMLHWKNIWGATCWPC